MVQFWGPLHRSLSPSFISPSLHRSLGFEHNGSVILVGLELLSYFPATDQLRQQAVVSLIMADAAGDDCGVDVGFAGESVDCEYGGSFAHGAGLPELWGDECVLGQGVGFVFERVPSGQGEVVDEEFVFVAVEMEADVGQFVHEAEPEVVDAVVAQGEADDRAAVQET